MHTIGNPGTAPTGAATQLSSNQSAPSTPRSQRRQPTPPAPCRGASRPTGGSSGRGVSPPSNGHVSHSSTGGVPSAPCVRAQNSSGVSGTPRGLLVRALPGLVAVELLG